QARQSVPMLPGSKPPEILLNSGRTESDKPAISGVAWAASARRRHIVTTAIEHKAVLQECALLGRHGFDVTYVGVDGDGLVDPEAVAAAINERTVLVSVMAANNEVGTVQPVAEIGSICRARRVAFHVAAVQAAPSLPIDVNAWQADVVSTSGHKLYGPKGIGALFVRQGTAMVPLLQGGERTDPLGSVQLV